MLPVEDMFLVVLLCRRQKPRMHPETGKGLLRGPALPGKSSLQKA